MKAFWSSVRVASRERLVPSVRRTLGALLGIPLLCLVSMPAGGLECKLPSDLRRLEYDIQWMGDRVGELVIAFERGDELLTVQNRVDVDARLFFHSLFRFTHVSEEQWRGGSLVNFRGVTVDNGRRREVQVSPRSSTYYVDGKGGPYEVPLDTPLLSAWCKASISGPRVIEPTKGRIKALRVRSLNSPSTRGGRQQPLASRVRVEGDLRAEIWYDSRGIVTFARFPVRGGTMGALVLRAPALDNHN